MIPRYFASLGDGRALFSLSTSSSGRQLWVTDGTTQGTHLVTDINPGASDSFPGKFESSGTGSALFTADDGTDGQELWLTNGVAEGTHCGWILNSGNPPINPKGFAVVAEKSVPTMGGDIITGTGSTDTLFGDTSETLSDSVEGGNDQISGLGDADILLGYASTLSGNARGGDDRLSGDAGSHGPARRRPFHGRGRSGRGRPPLWATRKVIHLAATPTSPCSPTLGAAMTASRVARATTS